MSDPGNQSAVSEFLAGGSVFGGAHVRVVETHVSRVFIGPERVLKLKRAVKFPYLDFSTLAQRKEACEAEIEINRRTAPALYQGLAAVTQENDGSFALDGSGEVVEWLVDMLPFDEETLFDRLAAQGRLKRRLIEETADAVAGFHDIFAVTREFGGRVGTASIIDNNREAFSGVRAGILDARALAKLDEASRSHLERVGAQLDTRREAGLVRHCHGDLHLRNICLVDGKPTPFDAIEFNASFSHIDVLYDLAFLLMDLDFRGQRRLASIAFNRYLDRASDELRGPGVFEVLPLFLSMRAAVRSHVDAVQAETLADPETQARRAAEAAEYLDLANRYLDPAPARLVAAGGLSGCGKSRMSREIAQFLGRAPGARVVRTDVVRKRLAGARLEEKLAPQFYSPQMNEATYEAFYDEIREGLRQGQCVVADAVFAQARERAEIGAMAESESVPFDGLWLEAPPDVMEERIRKRKNNVSDATADVLKRQLAYDVGDIDWARVDSAGSRAETLAKGCRVLGVDPP